MTRNSLKVSLVEGLLAEVVGACASTAVLTAWALWLSLPPVLIGILGALPFVAQVAQLPAAWVARRFGDRTTALWAVSLSRQAILPLALLPVLPEGMRKPAFLSVALISAALSVIGNNAWTTWMGDLVPARLRGRYFGRRTALCALASTVAGMSVGVFIDSYRSRAEIALAALAVCTSVCGALTTALLARQREPRRHAPAALPAVRELLSPLRDGAFRRLLAFHAAWSAAGGIAAAFYSIHLVANLHTTFAFMALYNAAIGATRTLAAPLWGRAVDRAGARPVIAVCAAALCVSPLLWLLPTHDALWPLFIDAPLCGIGMAGLSLATFALPMELARPHDRGFYVGLLATAGGLATAVASAGGGLLAHALPGVWTLAGKPLVAAQQLFLIGAAGRSLAALLALRLEQRAAPVIPLRTAERRARLAA